MILFIQYIVLLLKVLSYRRSDGIHHPENKIIIPTFCEHFNRWIVFWTSLFSFWWYWYMLQSICYTKEKFFGIYYHWKIWFVDIVFPWFEKLWSFRRRLPWSYLKFFFRIVILIRVRSFCRQTVRGDFFVKIYIYRKEVTIGLSSKA